MDSLVKDVLSVVPVNVRDDVEDPPRPLRLAPVGSGVPLDESSGALLQSVQRCCSSQYNNTMGVICTLKLACKSLQADIEI
jgi:hypothetical protein